MRKNKDAAVNPLGRGPVQTGRRSATTYYTVSGIMFKATPERDPAGDIFYRHLVDEKITAPEFIRRWVASRDKT